jgi:hypothetical protein
VSTAAAVLTAGTMLLAGMAGAEAQSPQCDRWRAELANLPRGGGNPGAAAQAGRVGAELSRTINSYRAMGCENQQFLFFGSPPPPQCGGVRARIGQLQAQFASLQSQAQGGGFGERRAQLQAAIDGNCRPGMYQTPEPPRPRGFFEALFGVPEQPQYVQPLDQRDPLLDPNPDEKKGVRYGAGQAVCVKTCDGSFFPLATSPGGRESHDEMCQALCPSAETRVFYMNGSGDISDASTRGGEGYLSLANANKFTRTFDPTCGCRKPGESWSAALREAEEMLERRRGDMIVSEAKARELSQPRGPRALSQREQRRLDEDRAKELARQQAAAAAFTPAGQTAAPVEANPVAGQESAGIGSIAWGSTVGIDTGRKVEVTASDGEKKLVRVVVPSPLSASGQTTGSVAR